MRPARIVVLAKQPVAGRVKTRLIPALGAEGAARLAGEMLATTLDEARASGLAVELCGDPDPALWCDAPVAKTAQGEGDLGDRLARAAKRVLGAGENVLLIGADCPDLDAGRLRAGALALKENDAFLHPTQDGGYALLGLARYDPSLFANIPWSTGRVAAETIARIEALEWPFGLGETLRDLDEPADLGPNFA